MNRNIFYSIPISLLIFFYTIGFTQIVEIPLSSATMANPHYNDAGHNDNPMALINDPFFYEAAEPRANMPVQTYERDAQAQPRTELVPELSTYHASFPRGKKDSNWYAAEIVIPTGKYIEYLDVWGRNDVNLSDRHRRLVIILESPTGARWYSRPWSGVTSSNTIPSAYGRFDFTSAGVTDNILTTANKIIIARDDRKGFMTIAEIRLAGNDNPFFRDSIAPILTEVTTGTVIENTNLTARCNENGTMYMVPSLTTNTIASIQQASIKKWACVANSPYTFPLSGFQMGSYKIYALDLNNNLSEGSEEIIISEDTQPPVLNLSSDSIEVTSWIHFTCDEKANIYLVKKGTKSNYTSITTAAQKHSYVQPGSHVISTYNLEADKYVLYAIDAKKNISNVTEEIVLINKTSLALQTVPIQSAEAGNFHFYLAKYGVGRYTINDTFDYNPNDPYTNTPDQTYEQNVNDENNWTGKAGDEENCWLKVNFTIPEGEKLEILDIWGRKYESGIGEMVDDSDASLHRNLVISLSNGIDTWSGYTWSGAGTATSNGAYGRFEFSTAEVNPPDLLKSATELKIQHNKGNQEMIIISEVRLAHSTPPVANAGPDQQVDLNEIVTLDASLSVPFSSLTYSWKQIDGPTVHLIDSNEIDPIFISPAQNTRLIFELKVIDAKGQHSKQPDQVTILVGELSSDIKSLTTNRIKVFPNPSSAGFQVDLSGKTSRSSLSIQNAQGHLIFETFAESGQVYFIKPSVFQSVGMYILKINSDEGILVKKLIVH